MEILTGEQMRRIDRRAFDEFDVPSLQLMEAAGRGIAGCLIEDYPGAAVTGVVVLCGKGNNGGDGLVAARYLARRGVEVEVLLLAAADELRGDAAANLVRAREAGIDVQEVTDDAAWDAVRERIAPPRMVLDAMLGTGVKGGARGPIARAIDALNGSGCRVVSVDLPSGIDADSGEVPASAVAAERTYTLCRPKRALVLEPAASLAGSWRVVPIGIPDAAVAAENADMEWLDAAAAAPLLPPRPAEGHKGTFGHLLVVAGSPGKTGAAVLVGRAALRSGAGLVTVATPASCRDTIAAQQAELMTEALPELAGRLTSEAAYAATDLASRRSALALGPGLGTAESIRAFVRDVVADRTVPLVLDADGLNAMAGFPAATDGGPPMVWTPHPGEAARLLGSSARAVQAERLDAARRLARGHGVTLVLKGRRTLIATPDGRVSVNASGNAGMASGGTGDALTGAVGAFLARGLNARDAARLAVFVHGDAGDRAAERLGQEGLIASDLIDELPRALAALAGAAPA